MKKILTQSLAVCGAALALVGCTCPVCQGSGLQTVVSTYQKVPGGSYYKETATVKCGSCWGSGRNWGAVFGAGWFAGAGFHAYEHAHHHHGGPPPPPHGGPHRHH